MVAADGTCIPAPGPGEHDEIVDAADSAPACPTVNENPLWYAQEMPDDPFKEMAHFRWEKGYLSKVEDLYRGTLYSEAKYYNSRDILSENTARWVMRPGYINVKCTRQFRIPLSTRKSVVRFTITSNGTYDGRIERAL